MTSFKLTIGRISRARGILADYSNADKYMPIYIAIANSKHQANLGEVCIPTQFANPSFGLTHFLMLFLPRLCEAIAVRNVGFMLQLIVVKSRHSDPNTKQFYPPSE